MKAAFPLALGLRMLRGKAGTARYLKGAVLGVALGLVPLLVVMEVSTGMIDGITGRLIEIRSYHLQLILPASSSRAHLEDAAREIRRISDVTDAIPERQGIGLLFKAGKSAGVTLRLVPEDFFRRDSGLRKYAALLEGSGDLTAPGSILIGAALARKLGLKAGQPVTLLTPYSGSGKGLPSISTMTVAGVFDTGYQELEKLFVYASIESSWKTVSALSASAMIGVKVKDPFADLSGIQKDIRERFSLGSRVYTWRETESSRLSSFAIMKALLVFIMALIVLVAGVNVSSSVIMIAFERRFEIGILKSIGATPGSIASSFMLAGFVTGVLGTAGGILVGLLAAVNINEIMGFLQAALNAVLGAFSTVRSAVIPSAPALEPVTIFNSEYYLVTIPIRLRWLEVVIAAAGTIALSGIAAYLPARRAASAAPLEIIRKV
jgi:lipoprotein-releasing system permease protein